METLLVIAAIGIIIFGWLILSGRYHSLYQSTEAMSQESLSNAFIEIKKRILTTSSFDKKHEYQRLYFRADELITKILERHERYILDFEAKRRNNRRGAYRMPDPIHHYSYPDPSGISRSSCKIAHDLDPSKYSDEQLIYWCFFLWHGGTIAGIGEIDSDPKLMLKILEHLIDKQNADAMFLKGMTLKYGANCRIPDDCIDSKRYPLFIAREAMRLHALLCGT